MKIVDERFGKSVIFHASSAMGMDLDGLLAFLETRDKVRIKSGVVYPGDTPVCECRSQIQGPLLGISSASQSTATRGNSCV